jgi:hypothetical protein
MDEEAIVGPGLRKIKAKELSGEDIGRTCAAVFDELLIVGTITAIRHEMFLDRQTVSLSMARSDRWRYYGSLQPDDEIEVSNV